MAEKQLQSFYNVGPGDYILDFLDSFGWTQNDLADVTGFSLKSINQLINNKRIFFCYKSSTIKVCFLKMT